MAFLVQHGKSRAVGARKPPRPGTRASARSPTKRELRRSQLAARLLAACFLAPALCICAARLRPAQPPQLPLAGTGSVYPAEGSHVSSDDAEAAAGARSSSSSQQGSVDNDGHRLQEPSAPVPARSGSDPDDRGSPELDVEVESSSTKHITDLDNKSGTKGVTTSSSDATSSPPGNSVTTSPQSADTDIQVPKPKSNIYCDDKSEDEGFPYARPVVCQISGDVRVSPETSSVALITPTQQGEEEEETGRRVTPYARKDESLLHLAREVAIRAVASGNDAPVCSISHDDVPAVIFSVGGYTGNFFHDMSDVLVPLYLTSFRYKGRVKFFVTDYKRRWVQRYRPVLRRLSRHGVVDFDSDRDVHCLRHVTLGLARDRDLVLRPHPTRNPEGHSMLDFTRFLRRAYGLRRAAPLVLGERPGERPRMLIVSRRRTRRLLNLRQVAAASRALGFDVVVAEAGPGSLKRFAAVVNSCDVLLAVHGAGLTNQVFLPPRAVVVQIVPWGKLDWMATNFYGQPAQGMGLRYLEYHVSEQESSLARRYPRDHLVFRDPMAIHGQGWGALADVFMAQDVRLNVRRFRPTLLQALDLLQA